MMSRRSHLLASVLAASFAAICLPISATPAIAQQAAKESGRDTYIHQNEGTFEEWGKKVDALNARAAQRGNESKEAAKREIDRAWAETKAGWEKLKNVSAEGWQNAKASFEASRQKLERVWNESQS